MSPLPPEIERMIEASFTADEARARKRRMETGFLDIELESAPDDKPVNDPEFQAELNTFSGALHQGDVQFTQTAVAFDSVDAHGYPLAEFAIQILNSSALKVVGAAITAWLHGRYGRKVRLQFSDVKVEGRTPEEVDQALKSAAAYQASIKEAGKKP
jgi:hypothetical protein